MICTESDSPTNASGKGIMLGYVYLASNWNGSFLKNVSILEAGIGEYIGNISKSLKVRKMSTVQLYCDKYQPYMVYMSRSNLITDQEYKMRIHKVALNYLDKTACNTMS